MKKNEPLLHLSKGLKKRYPKVFIGLAKDLPPLSKEPNKEAETLRPQKP